MKTFLCLLFLFRLDYSNSILRLSGTLEPGYGLYSSSVELKVDGRSLEPLIPPPEHITNFLALAYTGVALPAEAVFTYQGCKNDICFMPKTIRWQIAADGTATERIDGKTPTSPSVEPTPEPKAKFRSAGGYMNADQFLAFLDGRPAETVQWRGWITILLILAGGVLLNLTPCVLPMIPINLAIIGAAGNRRTGILYGSAYALGITAAYGSLGLFSLFTGSIFGTVQASPWFNLGIGGLFLVLTLAMLDILAIDFSRFLPRTSSKTGVFTAFTAGAIGAVLAGACVAPIVIAVLLLSSTLYAAGHFYALLLPFVLGLGMGLPWPILGAGVEVLPKPGNWLNYVKKGFAVFLVLFAGYYLYLGVGLLRTRTNPPAPEQAAVSDLPKGVPVLLDFWATWCKNCTAMEETTFQNPRVRERLKGFRVVRVQAEDPSAPETKKLLEQYGITGLPTFVILPPSD